ncbi:MAG TPA: hypothetical protein VI541_02400 [Actinomycetota bacterium]|nr:hypothetical protein [Actinomycetota bacterium]
MQPTKPTQDDSLRVKAYRSGAKMARGRMETEAPLDAEALRRVVASDIVVVSGTYDHVESVLSALEMPFQLISADQLPSVVLRPEQLLVINCPGNLPPRAVGQVREFVTRGGSLFTTDWALRHVIEPAFPGFIEYNERPTADDVVRIEIRSKDNQFLRGVIDGSDDPQWWLEGSSYPIRVVDTENVEVLLVSKELADKYGESPVAVTFRFGKGEVFHMISHYYLQRTELRSERHNQSAMDYASEKGFIVASEDRADFESLPLGEVESAQSSARLFANIIADKKRKSRPSAR